MRTSANDFRIGNWFYNSKEHETQVYKIDEDSVNGIIYTDFCGIILTDEWLKRFGFKKVSSLTFELKPISIFIQEEFNHFEVRVFSELMNKESIPKYVHTLQNLYFALTGEELIKKNNSYI